MPTSRAGLRKGMCQCRNKNCNAVFYQSEYKTIRVNRYGIMINEKVCPECEGHSYGLIDYRNFKSIENVYKIWEVKYIFGRLVKLS